MAEAEGGVAGGVVGGGEDEVGAERRAGIDNTAGAVGADDHERGGKGVGLHAGGGDDGGGEDGVLHGIAVAGIDGVGIAAPVAHVEVTVVA